MIPVFHNTTLQKEFELKGYVVIERLLTIAALNELKTLFEKYQSKFEGPFHTSHFSSDVVYKKEVHEAIAAIVFACAGKYLEGYAPVFGNFMIKNPDPAAAMDLHADWAYVDETKYSSAAIWIPLIDVNEENGCLGVIEGSHTITNLIRGPRIRQSTGDHHIAWQKRLGTLLPIKAGDAIIYNHRLLHYSHPNKTSVIRPAINLSIVPVQAECIHYCMPEGTEDIHLYSVPDSNFYIQYTHFQTPASDTLIKTLPKATVKYIDPVMEKFRQERSVKSFCGPFAAFKNLVFGRQKSDR
jgi:hypothetical protein